MSIYDDIRSTLESELSSISGVPYIAYENVSSEDRPPNQSFLKCQLFPTSRKPACRGTNPQMLYKGVFTVYCYIPEGIGPGEADDLADQIIDTFEATTDLSWVNPDNSKTTTVSIEYAEREQGMTNQPYYYVPVNVHWYLYN